MNEITITASLSFSKDGKTASLAQAPTRFTMTGGDYAEGTLTASTDEANLVLPGTNTEGWCLIKNLSATIDIFLGVAGGSHNVKVPANGVALFAHGSAALSYKTTSSTAEFQYLLLEL